MNGMCSYVVVAYPVVRDAHFIKCLTTFVCLSFFLSHQVGPISTYYKIPRERVLAVWFYLAMDRLRELLYLG